MIIHRMRLRNFRGVDEREVEFEPIGVTILEGPNEVGKSSHIDALNHLLEYKATSRHSDVKATQPVHRDEGPEAEIEAEAGPYRFRYRKRWLKSPVTELEIIAPIPENLTGDLAHERVLTILSETTDLDLWRALRIMQGDSTREVNLSDTQALSKALDVAAGTTPVGDEETALFQAVVSEFSLYWTPKGHENKDLKEAERRASELETKKRDVDNTILGIEAAAETLEMLKRDIVDTKQKGPELEERVRMAEAEWEKARSAAKAEEQAKTELDLARERRDQAQNAKRRLQELERKAAESREELEEHCKSVSDTAALDRARRELEERQEHLDALKEVRKEAEAGERLRQADADDRHYVLDLEQLRERKEAIDAARLQAEEARKVVATSQATDENRDALRKALDRLHVAEASLNASAPKLRVELLGEGRVLVDGRALEPQAGVTERSVESETVVEVADHVRIAVTPGADLHELREAVAQHNEEADRLLKIIGADDWASAAEANRRLTNAKRQVDELRDIEKDKLRDLTYDNMVDRIREVEARVQAYAERRESTLPMPADFDQARELLEAAQAQAVQSRKAEEEAEGPVVDARARFEELQTKHNQHVTEAEVLQAQADTAAKNLEEAKQELTDATGALAELETNLRVKEIAWSAAAEDRRANDPETTKLRLDNVKAVFGDHATRMAQLDREATEVNARIKVHEEDGLFELQQRLASELGASERNALTMRRRADAVRLVHDILSEERDNARQAYVSPLREAVERLGRIVHGNSFSVKIGDDLSIEQRTLDGRTLNFEQLSAGAKEQLGILIRAACAMLVAKDGRIPLILDDTLGNTDPARLEAMGAVLKRAGQDAQVIILTCVPDRFRQVGGARVVRLEPGGARVDAGERSA